MADADYQRLAPACLCGTKLPTSGVVRRLRKHCSDECRVRSGNEQAKSRAAHVCETCRQEFRTYKTKKSTRWCSDECKPKALRGLFSCLQCGLEYRKKGRRPGEGEKFCTRSCAAASRAKGPTGVCPWFAKRCATCDRPGGKRRDWTYCDACANEARKRDARNAARLAGEMLHRASARVVACADCKAEFCPLYGASMTRLCPACRIERDRAHARVAKSRRRARQRGVEAESIDPIEVFKRDGWMCQLCKCKTPRSKRGTYDDDAPELDHIVPLGKGGAHTWANVQCSCRKCNGAKGDRPLGQLLLIG